MAEAQVRIAPLTRSHWAEVVDIYAAGIAAEHATFEVEPPTWEQFDAQHPASTTPPCRSANGTVLGWVAASRVSERCVYAGVVEHSVYVHPGSTGRGIGGLLLDALIDSTEADGIWTIQSGIFPENLASLAMHRSDGFREVGVRR